MTNSNDMQSSYELNISKAINAIQADDLSAALGYIKCAVLEDQNAPKVHNLLGIIAELKKDLSLAGKHYRASYALDPTFKPASRNLERITSFFYNRLNSKPVFGDIPEEEIIPYVVEYDEMNVGRLRKRSEENEKK